MSNLRSRSGIELSRELERADCPTVRQSGSHRHHRLPNGETVIVPQHPSDLGTGLLRKLIKAIAAAGVVLGALIFWIWYLAIQSGWM